MSNNYTKDDIQVLSDIEHIRLRPGMYVGEAIDPHQLLQEVLDNSIDEYSEGYGDKIELSVDTNLNKYLIKDYGRGIPHGEKELEGGVKKEVLEILFTIADSGGKFNNKNYITSAGLHGVGATLTNALSKQLYAESRRGGESVIFESTFDNPKGSIRYDKTKDPDGTTVWFIPSEKYFDLSVIPLEFIKNIVKTYRAFGINIILIVDGQEDEEVKKVSSLNYLLDKDRENDKIYVDKEFDIKLKTREHSTVKLRYTNQTSCAIKGYTNYLYNSMGGSHVRLLKSAIQEVWKEFYKDLEVELKDDDCLLGVSGLIAVFLSEISFSSQTKEKLTIRSESLDNIIFDFKKQFRKYLIENEDTRKSLLKRFVEYRLSQNKLLAQKDIKNVVIVNQDKSDSITRKSVVKDLVDCTSKNREGTELYIMEGKSASGPVIRTRDKNLQAVLSLRGKIKNVTNMDIKDILQRDTVVSIINSVGAGVLDQCDADKSRYEKIFLWTDEDPDGYHIKSLLLSLFVNVMPDIVKKGRVYVIDCPFYRYEDPTTKEFKYCKSHDDIPQGAKGIERFKGIGSMNDDEIHDACLIPGNRIIYRINYPDDLDKFNRIMGSSEGRSELLRDEGILVGVTDSDNVSDNDEEM